MALKPLIAVAAILLTSYLIGCRVDRDVTLASARPPDGLSSRDRGDKNSNYTAFANETPVAITGYSDDAMEPFVSKDGKYIFFNNRNDPAIDTNIYYAARITDAMFVARGKLPGVNSKVLDAVPSMDSAGRFYFISTRTYASSLSTIYTGLFAGEAVSQLRLLGGVSRHQPGYVNFDAEISVDGNTLWFNDGRYDGHGHLLAATIAVAERVGTDFVRRRESTNMLANVNSGGLNYAPSISMDGLELFFTRIDTDRTDTHPEIFRAVRRDANSPFTIAQHVTGATGFVEAPSLSADGHLLYYHKMVSGKFQIYVLRR